MPVGHEVSLARDAPVVDSEQIAHVGIAQAAAQELAAQERRVPDDELGGRPFGLAWVRRV